MNEWILIDDWSFLSFLLFSLKDHLLKKKYQSNQTQRVWIIELISRCYFFTNAIESGLNLKGWVLKDKVFVL